MALKKTPTTSYGPSAQFHQFGSALDFSDFFADPLPADHYPQPRPPEPRSAEEQAVDAAWDAEQDCDDCVRER
jgi:hypothetical protein